MENNFSPRGKGCEMKKRYVFLFSIANGIGALAVLLWALLNIYISGKLLFVEPNPLILHLEIFSAIVSIIGLLVLTWEVLK